MASKSDLAKAVALQENIKVADATSIIDTTIKTLIELAKTGKVTIIGFGTFEQKTTKARQGRNPRTGEAISIPAKTVVRFHPSKSLVGIAQRSTSKQPGKKSGSKNSKDKSRK